MNSASCQYNCCIWTKVHSSHDSVSSHILYYETLYHIPSIIVVHMVKGRQHSVHIRCPNRGDGVSRPQKWQILMLQSQRWTWQRSTASKIQISRVVDGVLYIAQATYVYIRDYARQDFQPAIFVRESSTQLIMYSLDICVRYSTYLPIFKSQKGSIEALNFLIITS
jgi:hypothetical protein